jgi:hypothetical protein
MEISRLNSSININDKFLKPASDVSGLNPNDSNFFQRLTQIFENEKGKLSQIAPGVYVPSPGKYQTINFSGLNLNQISTVS